MVDKGGLIPKEYPEKIIIKFNPVLVRGEEWNKLRLVLMMGENQVLQVNNG